MRDIFEGLYDTSTEEGKKKSQWCSILCYLCLLVTFIISCCASYKASKGYLNKTLFTYKFPMFKGEHNFPPGTPVSIDWDGYVQRGAGFGIYRNVTVTGNQEMRQLKVEVIGKNVIVSAYNGFLALQYIDGDEVSKVHWETLPKVRGNNRKVDHLIQLNDTKVVLIGSNALLPITIVTKKDGKERKFEVIWGLETLLITKEGIEMYPHADNLDQDSLVLTYEEKYQLMACVAIWEGTGDKAQMRLTSSQVAEADGVYNFHGVSGMSKNKFIMAAMGVLHNDKPYNDTWMPLRAKVGVIADDYTITFSDWVIRHMTNGSMWFAMDNFNSREALITYYDTVEANGVVALACFLDMDDKGKDTVRFGGYSILETGGALKADAYQTISLRMLSFNRFGVVFPDASSNGNLIFVMGERTENNDIMKIGSNMVIARARNGGTYWFALGAVDWNRFVIIDSYKENEIMYSSTNVGYHLAYPVGIATSRNSKDKSIQFHGVFKFSRVKLTPGYTYYTNSKGDMIRGRPYGFNHAEFGNFYVTSMETYELCALHNQIGIAVSEHELLIRTY